MACTDHPLQETLDELEPLRHFMHSNGTTDSSSPILPPQLPSIFDQSTQLSFHSPSGGCDAREISIKLITDASPGCGGITWPAGEVGPFSLSLPKGSDVYPSPLLNIMHRNIEINNLSSAVTPVELNWGDSLPVNVPATPDLILAADCVYFEPAFPLLVQTLGELAVDNKTEILFCYKKRRKADKRFFGLLKKKFTWLEITDDPDRAIYSRQGISLLRLVRKQQQPLTSLDQHILTFC